MKHPLNPQPCACGCGEMTSGKWKHDGTGYPRYVAGHQRRGVKLPPSKERDARLQKARDKSSRKALKPLLDYCAENRLGVIEYIRSEYWDGEQTLRQIAGGFGITSVTLGQFMKRNDIPRRSASQAGKLVSEGFSKIIIERNKRFIEGGVRWIQSKEGRESMRGENNPAWRGGSHKQDYDARFNEALRREIRERDNYTCQECGAWANQCHHIDYDKKNSALMNLITLCKICHPMTNSATRDRWAVHYQVLMASRFAKQLELFVFPMRTPELTTKPSMGTISR